MDSTPTPSQHPGSSVSGIRLADLAIPIRWPQMRLPTSLVQVEHWLIWLALGLFIFWVGIWLLHCIALGYSKWHLYPCRKSRESLLPGVSIIKPLLGVDANLATNLESFFVMTYPCFELLFCVHNESDPALMVVRMLMNKYKNVDARIFIGGEQVGLNPKINNMMPAYRAAQYGMVLVSDSGILIRPESLPDMAMCMTDDVAMVTQLPYCLPRKEFGARIEQIYFGTSHARIYLAGNCLGFVCASGMSLLLRKSAMDDIGGMQVFSVYLAEDYFFASLLASRGWRNVTSCYPAWQNAAGVDARRFHNRICRWMKLRLSMLPHTIVLEPMQDCMLAGLFGSWSVNLLFGWNSLVFFLVHILTWMLFDYMLISSIQNAPLPFGRFEFAALWLYREVSAFPTYLRALWEPDIHWRSGTFRLKWGGCIQHRPIK